ncbi:hypothetical protein Ahy_B10g101204 [Arachis hypogaea]|uniref:Protein FAR1-RELATED SEQUENCE n=1 Tax=Arachis hypogaea TaxID=3818 RepID=A0A444WYT4_ARAHY|nr:hypothetical protein Ahy_B10g101204 [Arachis hypogaea]
MNDSTSNQLNENDLVYSSETNNADETSYVVDERFVPKVGMIFKTLEEAGKFYKHYSKLVDQAEMLKQHRELSMFVRHTIESNEEAGIRPIKTYQSFVVAAGSHRELSFIEKDVRNYITRDVRNISEEDDAKEFRKNWNDFLIKYGLGGNKWLSALYEDRYIWIPVYLDHHFWGEMRSIQRSESKHSFFNNHSLSILSFERVDNVAPKYILERWSKNIKRRHTHIKSSQDEPLLKLRSKRFDDLVFRSHSICKFASESEELTRILHRAFDKVMAEMQEYQEKSKEKSSLSHEETTLSDVNDLQSPPRVKTRGRLNNRLGSNLEKKISNAMKKKEKDNSK